MVLKLREQYQQRHQAPKHTNVENGLEFMEGCGEVRKMAYELETRHQSNSLASNKNEEEMAPPNHQHFSSLGLVPRNLLTSSVQTTAEGGKKRTREINAMTFSQIRSQPNSICPNKHKNSKLLSAHMQFSNHKNSLSFCRFLAICDTNLWTKHFYLEMGQETI